MEPDRRPAHGADAPIQLAEALLRFAEPLLDRSDPTIKQGECHALISVALMVWNAEIARASGQPNDLLDGLLARFRADRDPASLGPLVEMLVRRKQGFFSADRRTIDEWGLVKEPDTAELWVEVKGGGRVGTGLVVAKGRPKGPRRLDADMRKYMDDRVLFGLLPTSERNLAKHFGAIVTAASAAPEKERIEVEVGCRRKSGPHRCKGKMSVVRNDAIEWECPGCGESGRIEGWRGSPWDLAERERVLGAMARSDVLSVGMSAKDVRALERSIGLDWRGLAMLLGAQRSGRRLLLLGTREEVESLAVAAQAEMCEAGFSPISADFDAIHEKLHAALGVSASVAKATMTAEILCHRAISERGWIRSAPRMEDAGGHRLSVVLDEVEPCVRRELLVPSDMTLEELHYVLQVAFGWTESHLHQFLVGRECYMRPDHDEMGDTRATHDVRLMDVVPAAGGSLVYEYDFGDSWRHVIGVVEVVEGGKAPEGVVCLYGEGAAPPEDCGGAGGYEELQRVLADPSDEEHEDMREWAGEGFDPLAFDLEATNRLLARLWRRLGAKIDGGLHRVEPE